MDTRFTFKSADRRFSLLSVKKSTIELIVEARHGLEQLKKDGQFAKSEGHGFEVFHDMIYLGKSV